jgi:hypothetical protein
LWFDGNICTTSRSRGSLLQAHGKLKWHVEWFLGSAKKGMRRVCRLKVRDDSGQTYSTDISGHRQIRLLPLKESGMTSHRASK